MAKIRNIKNEVLELRSSGLSYSKIARLLGCSKSSVIYHCGEGQKEKTKKRQQRNRATKVLTQKVRNFQTAFAQPKKTDYKCDDTKLFRDKVNDFQRERIKGKNGKHFERTFDRCDLLNKFGTETECYLTGRKVNLTEPKTYHLDHMLPVCKGGDNSFDNLAIACKDANQAKHQLTINEFLQLCKEVLEYHGYTVDKK